MLQILDRVIVKVAKRSVLEHLSTLADTYDRMNAILEKLLILSNLDPRPQKIQLQNRAQHILFVYNIELAGIQAFTTSVKADKLEASSLLKMLVLASSQIKKNKKEEGLLEDLLKSYDGFTDQTLAKLTMIDSWVN